LTFPTPIQSKAKNFSSRIFRYNIDIFGPEAQKIPRKMKEELHPSGKFFLESKGLIFVIFQFTFMRLKKGSTQ